jgi:hypothetical protein
MGGRRHERDDLAVADDAVIERRDLRHGPPNLK